MPEKKPPGAPRKPPAEIARTRATRWTDADWADLKLVTMDRARELVRREAAKMRKKYTQ